MFIEVPVETGCHLCLGVFTASFVDQSKTREKVEIIAAQVNQCRNTEVLLRAELLPHHVERHVYTVLLAHTHLQAKARIQQTRMQKEMTAGTARRIRSRRSLFRIGGLCTAKSRQYQHAYE